MGDETDDVRYACARYVVGYNVIIHRPVTLLDTWRHNTSMAAEALPPPAPPAPASLPSPTAASKAVPSAASASLHERLAATRTARHAAIGASRSTPWAQRAYRSSSLPAAWTVDLFTFRSRGLGNIWMPLLVVLLVSSAWTSYSVAFLSPDSQTCATLRNAETAFGLWLTSLSFLLVFRLNRSATRHWEARQLCGGITVHCRDLAITASTGMAESPQIRDRLCEIAVAFPVAFMLHIWGEPLDRADAFESMLEGVFDKELMAAMRTTTHRPLALIQYAQSLLNEWKVGRLREASTAQAMPRAVLDAPLYTELLKTIRGFGPAVGGCERVQGTPLPFAYVVHLRSFLLLVLCGIPFVYSCEWRFATIPLSVIIAFGLLGIEAASVACQRPFSEYPTKNHHDLERFATGISDEVTDVLMRAKT